MIESNACQNIDEIRKEIDTIDYEIISLIAKRAQYVTKAAEFKTDESSVKAPERVKNMLEKRKQWAADKNIDAEFIENMFFHMVNYFINKEMHVWKNKQNKL